MKSQRGVTLTSLATYIMLVLIIVGILATITANFRNNIKEINKEGTNNSEIDKFNIYFLKEVKKQGNEVEAISDNEILFTMGNKYTFKDDNSIYLNDNIKIAENIEKCVFSNSLVDGKKVITVIIKANNAEEKTMEYVLSNEAYSSSYEDENDYFESKDTDLALLEKYFLGNVYAYLWDEQNTKKFINNSIIENAEEELIF